MLLRVVDLETTGLAPPDAAVCEIGYVDVVADGKDLLGAPTDWRVVPRVWSAFVDPGQPIPLIAQRKELGAERIGAWNQQVADAAADQEAA